MPDLLRALHSGRVLLMDGAMGTELQRAGIQAGACYEEWNLTHPDRVRAIHEAYIQAGAECLLTNTFQSNPVALARHRLDHRLEENHRAAVELARSAAGEGRFVLGDVGPIDALADEAAIRRTVGSFPGVDGLLLETYSDLASALRVVEVCCGSVPGIPVLVSFTYLRTADGDIRTRGGELPETIARAVLNVAALGVNCGRDMGLPEVGEVLRRYRERTHLPLFARPNAGTPTLSRGNWAYPLTPGELAVAVAPWLGSGVGMVGGCCGTTPGHVAALRLVIEAWNAQEVTAMKSDSPAVLKRRWTAPGLRKLPPDVRAAILQAAASLAEKQYRTNPALTAFEAFALDDLQGDNSSTETK